MSKQPGESRKVRWTVPAADASVAEWLDVQHNVSLSLRQLIRESIQRDGYIDVAYRPVGQLPRRGRPPQADAAGDGDGNSENAAAVDGEREEPNPSEPAVDVEAPAGEAAQAPSGAPGQKAMHSESAPAAAGGQVDMEEIFGHGG